MQANLRRHLLPLIAALLVVLPASAKDRAVDNRPALHVVVVEPITDRASAFTDFDRLALALEATASRRAWPVKIEAERLAGGTPEHDPEVRLTLQRVRSDPGEYVFRAWTMVILGGKKHDFGIVTYRHTPRLGQNPDNLFEEIFRGGAAAIADRIEPVLFPELKKKN